MNQTRVFLLFAWLMVAALLWMEWTKERAAPPVAAPTSTAVSAAGSVPGATTAGAVPPAPAAAGPAGAATVGAVPSAPAAVTVRTDVLTATLDGGQILQADL